MNDEPRLRVIFYRTIGGNEPVREWLKALPAEDRRIIGHDLKTAPIRLAAGHALDPQGRNRALGSAHPAPRSNCARDRHSRGRYDGLATWPHQEIGEAAAARPAIGTPAAAIIAAGMSGQDEREAFG